MAPVLPGIPVIGSTASCLLFALPDNRQLREQGDKMGSKIWDNDILIIRSPLSIEHSFDDHIEWFSNKLMPHMSFLSEIKEQSGGDIDLFLSYSSNCDTGGFALNANSLKILNEFASIGILPGGFSVMFY